MKENIDVVNLSDAASKAALGKKPLGAKPLGRKPFGVGQVMSVGLWTKLAAAVALGLSGLAAFAQQTAPDMTEAALITGGLGKATETQNLGTGYAGGLTPGAGAQLLSKPLISAPVQAMLTDAKDQKAAVKLELPPLATTQFQKFVQDSTGKALSLYGYNLFDSGRFPAVTDVPAPANYVLGVGDEVDLKIWGVVDIALRLPVDRNGQITVPKVGPVTVAGVQADQLEKHLRTQIGRVFSNFELSATLGRLRTVQVFVVGQARKPGAYMVSSLSTLISALFDSGGPSATGSLRKIALVRQGKTVSTLDLYGFIHSGDTAGDARLLAGDVIVIPPAGARVALQGALDNPAVYELAKPEETLADLLRYSGGLQSLTATHKALVERVSNTQEKAPRSVDERTLGAQGLQSTVRDGDLVTLLPVSPEFANAVTLRGNVATPLRHAFKSGMRVSDLIPEASALIQRDYYNRKNSMVQYQFGGKDQSTGKEVSAGQLAGDVQTTLTEINWDYASIERLDPGAVKTRLIPFNLSLAVKAKDPAHNLLLQAGDVVTVFGVDDIPVALEKRSQFVRIGGEVKVPGIYEVQPGETLPQLLARAGGPTRDAYLYGSVLVRESTRAQQQENLNASIRRMEAQVLSQAMTQQQNVTDKDNLPQAQAQLASQRQALERMKSLKASGRIALEMNPERPELPAITLQDGDSITVPSRPSFVGVFGAVLTENAFIHRAGATVGDYIERAGPIREADLDAAMLVRSDGTVQANRAQRNWIGLGNHSFMNTVVQPGDSIFVPEVLDRRSAYTQFIQGAKDWTQLFYQFGLGAAAVKTLRN